MNELQLSDLETLLPQFTTRLQHFTREPVDRISKLSVGGNNQLYKIEFKSARPLLAKKYYSDSINRLEREFNALTFLNKDERLHSSVPQALWRNEPSNYGVYGFEEGLNKSGADLSKNDCRAIIDFVIELQRYRPSDIQANFSIAVRSSSSLSAYLNEVDWRIQAFKEAAGHNELDVVVEARVKALNAIERLHVFLADVRDKLQGNELAALFPPHEARLNLMDFSLYSILFRPDAKPCFVDFEYFGWDDPLHIVADFIQHDRTQGISPAMRSLILTEYLKRSDLSDATLGRLPITVAILGAVWAARHLIFLTEEKIKPRQFAAGDQFDRQGYIWEQLGKLAHRLDLLDSEIKAV